MSQSAHKTAWSRVARLYDLQLPLERPALRTLASMLAIRQAERVLDVGTGTGGLLREVARRGEGPVDAVGLDRSPEMLAQAERHLPSSWRTVLGDATALPFDDGSFDVVTASYLLHLLDERERARVIGELRRVLRPAGRLGVITVAPAQGRPGSLLTAPARAVAARSRGVLGGLRPLDPSAELERAGLRVRNVRRVRRALPTSLCIVAENPAGSRP